MTSLTSRKIMRWVARNGFPNTLRIWCLKKAGVHIGKDVYIGEGFTLACDIGNEENLIIEDRVAIASNVTIIIDSYPNYSKLRNLKEKYGFIEVHGNVVIKRDSWIGAGAIIFPNVTVGEMSIVGAGSIVTKDVEPLSLIHI